MFNNLGIQWAGTLLGCLAAIMVPIPVVFYIWGHKIRGWSKNSGLTGGTGGTGGEGEEGEQEINAEKEAEAEV
jgi:DHA1 family multidrug resistance protein-like MFS transporter